MQPWGTMPSIKCWKRFNHSAVLARMASHNKQTIHNNNNDNDDCTNTTTTTTNGSLSQATTYSHPAPSYHAISTWDTSWANPVGYSAPTSFRPCAPLSQSNPGLRHWDQDKRGFWRSIDRLSDPLSSGGRSCSVVCPVMASSILGGYG